MIVDTLIDRIAEKQAPSCVGLDTAYEYLPESMRRGGTAEERAAEIFAFNRGIVDATFDLVPAVKVQIAYYEELGAAGVDCFKKTCAYAKGKGLIVIADAKRNDIGATASRYANAFLGENSQFMCDFLTVNGYLGSDGIAPFVEKCKECDRAIFVLVKTSNPSSGELQDLVLSDGRTVYERVGDMAEEWGRDTLGKYGYSRVGAVVGATHPKQAEILRERLPHTFFLIPGYGAQGGNAQMLKNSFRKGGMGGIVNNSRGILCAYRKRGGDFAEAARAAALEMKEDLLSVLGEICTKEA